LKNYSLVENDTIVAPITSLGKGAIAVIRLSGKEAVSICSQIFKGKSLEEADSHTIDFDTIEKNAGVTVRDRDSGKQERVAEADLLDYLKNKIG
jgi:tRNA U34 5-carboxymethylaminomethyl modifying GTPase MnmE/TrmE